MDWLPWSLFALSALGAVIFALAWHAAEMEIDRRDSRIDYLRSELLKRKAA